MTDDDQADIDRIEADRKRRERDLLLLLLGLTWNSRSHAVYAARSGTDATVYPARAARQVILGDNGGHFIGAAPLIVQAQEDAFERGYWRAGRLIGEHPEPISDDLRQSVLAQFRDSALRYAKDLARKIGDAINEVLGLALSPQDELAAIRKVYDDLQISRKQPGHFVSEIEARIVGAYNGGLYFAGLASALVTGLSHRSVIDKATTTICLQRDGLILPLTDPYWQRGICPLHWGCRSINLPVTGDFTPSEWRPSEPPAEGFGYPPNWGVAGGIRLAV